MRSQQAAERKAAELTVAQTNNRAGERTAREKLAAWRNSERDRSR